MVMLILAFCSKTNYVRERSSIMSARLGGSDKNADTADAGEGDGGSLIKCRLF